MSEQDDGIITRNDPVPNGEDTAPAAGLISQYVKDFSFENPHAPAVYQNQQGPAIDVQFNIASSQVGEEVFEIVLRIEVKAETEGKVAFLVDLSYAGLFGLRNIPEEHIQPFLLGEAPRLLFPFARRVLADAVRDGGFPPLMLASRLLGLVRDSLFARYVGASFASDAFLVAVRLPNMFRALFAEGAFSAAFIPMFNRKVTDKDGDGLPTGVAFAQDELSVLLPILIVMTIVLELFAWPVTLALSGKFHGVTHDQFAFAVQLSRFTIPYLMLISLVSLLGSILNSLHKFWVSAAAPILLNLTLIAALLFFHTHDPLVTARNQAIAVSSGSCV